jgi:hypothetical protein
VRSATLDAPAKTRALFLPRRIAIEPRAGAISLRAGRAAIALPETLTWRIARAPYYPELGREEERDVLVGEGGSVARAEWRFTISA